MNDKLTEQDLINLFGEKEYLMNKTANFSKFSKWDYTLDQLSKVMPSLDSNYFQKSEFKYYILNKWFVFRWGKNGDTKYGIGFDQEKCSHFDFMKG